MKSHLAEHPIAVFAFLLIAASLSGCASQGRPEPDLAPLLPISESRLETAPPAARDALEAGLRWITEDAPKTRVENEVGSDAMNGDAMSRDVMRGEPGSDF